MGEARMLEPKKTPPDPPPDQVLRELADLARVPAAQRDFYVESIRMNVQTACDRIGLTKNGLTKKQGERLLSSAQTIYETLGELTPDQQIFMNSVLGGKSQFIFDRISVGGIGGLRQTAYQLALLFSLVTGQPHPRYPHQAPLQRKRGKSQGGRRPGSIKDSIFQDFVFELWTSTKVAGGKLSFEKNTPKGELIEAMRRLAPYLPDRFVPKALSGSTLQKLKNLADELVGRLDEVS
jgi:hypothetical protein